MKTKPNIQLISAGFRYNLGAEGYDRTNRSELLPELDFDLLTRCVLMGSIGDGALEFERAIATHVKFSKIEKAVGLSKD